MLISKLEAVDSKALLYLYEAILLRIIIELYLFLNTAAVSILESLINIAQMQ